MLHELNNAKIAIIGLGYVGLPIALEFAKTYLSEEYVYRHISNIIHNQNKI